jgi:short-subunit dehydrogenase
MRLQDRRILITGAGGGIGSQLVPLLAERGARLCLISRGGASLRSLQQQVRDLPAAPLIAAADITVEDDRRRAVDQMREALGGVDVLINLAGMLDFRFFSEADANMIPRLLRVNLEAPMQLIHEVLPQMIVQGSGHIVNIGSMFGSIGFPGFATYSASKFALRGFSQALRRELAGTGVGVTYVSPRAVRTRFNPQVIHRMAERGMMRMDEAGWVASRIVKAIEKEKDEAYLGFPESLFARINAVLPGLVDRALRRELPALIDFSRQTP